MKKISLLLSLALLSNLDAQSCIDKQPILCHSIVVGLDTLPLIYLPTVTIESEMKFSTKKKQKEWNRLKENVRKAYPYAIIASAKLKEYEMKLKSIDSEKQREIFMENAEEQLRKDFESDLKKLSVSQGRVLIKLIHRETGRTSYSLVKKLRGGFSAFMWQGLARVFGSNLKSEYDPKEEDRLIEIAIIQIESGQ